MGGGGGGEGGGGGGTDHGGEALTLMKRAEGGELADGAIKEVHSLLVPPDSSGVLCLRW